MLERKSDRLTSCGVPDPRLAFGETGVRPTSHKTRAVETQFRPHNRDGVPERFDHISTGHRVPDFDDVPAPSRHFLSGGIKHPGADRFNVPPPFSRGNPERTSHVCATFPPMANKRV